MTKPTIEEVIAAANELAYSAGSHSMSLTNEKLQAFALHWYRVGLLDAAEKCENEFINGNLQDAEDAALVIREMAKGE